MMPAKTQEVFDHLKKCADEMRTVTYGELAEVAHTDRRRIGQPLGYIRDHICRPRRLPWLNVIAVKTSTRCPGESFLPQGVSFGDDDEPMWRGMVLHVFAYDWKSVNCEGD